MSTWILLRGLARESGHWGEFPDKLREEFPGIRVILLDLPGTGELHTVPSPLDVTAMAMHCRSQLKLQAVRPPFCLLAMSMGGMVATAWAARHPEELDACVLINTSFSLFSPLQQRMRARAWPILLLLLFAQSAQHIEETIFRLTSSLSRPPRRLLEQWIAIRRSRPVSKMNTLRQLFAAARFRAPAAGLRPTLILASARDRLVDPRCSMEIARRWNCALAIHPAAGHDLPLDDGEWVAAKVREWLTTAANQK